MNWDRIKTLLLLIGWGLAAVAVYIGKTQSTPPPQTKTEVVEQEKQAGTKLNEHTRTTIKKANGTVIEIEKTRDKTTKTEENSKSVATEQINNSSPKPNHSLAVQFKPDFRTMTFKPQELTYGYRLTGDLWITTGVTVKKEALVGIRVDF